MTDEQNLQTGDLEGKILGQYEIGRQLGQGGEVLLYFPPEAFTVYSLKEGAR